MKSIKKTRDVCRGKIYNKESGEEERDRKDTEDASREARENSQRLSLEERGHEGGRKG